jgi:hypothetical protein
MKRLARLALVLPLLAVLLISSVATQARTSDTPAQQYTAYLPLINREGQPSTALPPLSISVTADATSAASAPIGSEGGQLSAVGADGTMYTLDVPAGALAYTQTLSLTPSASVSGLPLSGGSLGAVQLAPADLLLMQPATLTISSAIASDVALTSYGYGFDGAGAEFHLRRADEPAALMSASPAAVKIITIRTPKLRGYGVARGKPAEASQYRERNRPSRTADQIAEDDLFVPLNTEGFIVSLQKSHAQVMGLLNQSANNPGLIEDAVVAYVEWLSSFKSSPGLNERFAPEKQQFVEGLRTAIKQASARAYQRCTDDNNALEGLRLQRWLYYLYTYALPMDPSYLEALVMKCFSFDVEFHSSITRDGTPTVAGLSPIVIKSEVAATISLRPRMNYPQFSLVGQSELTVVEASTTVGGECSGSYSQGTVAPVRVIDMLLIPAVDGGRVEVASLLFDSGTGIEGELTITCGESSFTSDWPVYAHEFATMHATERLTSYEQGKGGVFHLEDHWQAGQGEQVANTGTAYHRTKTFSASYIYVFTEQTDFEIYHRPQ